MPAHAANRFEGGHTGDDDGAGQNDGERGDGNVLFRHRSRVAEQEAAQTLRQRRPLVDPPGLPVQIRPDQPGEEEAEQHHPHDGAQAQLRACAQHGDEQHPTHACRAAQEAHDKRHDDQKSDLHCVVSGIFPHSIPECERDGKRPHLAPSL